MRRTWHRRLAALVLTLCPLAPAFAEPAGAEVTAPDWLAALNEYRIAAGLQPVVENPEVSEGIREHLLYMQHTPPQFLVGEYANLHRENPRSPYYTPTGDAAGRSSNLGGGPSDRAAIDGWMRAPFHAFGMLNPALEWVGFYRDPTSRRAGLDILRGTRRADRGPDPILFPGAEATVSMTSFTGESPNPLETCGWRAPAGLPIFALLPETPSPDLTAVVAGPLGDITGPELCIVHQHSYVSSDPTYGQVGGRILAGSKGVILIPRRPLYGGRYTARITQPGRSDVTWSFHVDAVPPPPARPAADSVTRIHVGPVNATVVGSLTIVDAPAHGYTTVFPCRAPRPEASTSNFTPGQTVAAFTAVRTDERGDVCVYVSRSVDVLWDHLGVVSDLDLGPPERRLDTRREGTPPPAGTVLRLGGEQPGAIVIANLTVVDATGPGFATAFGCADGRPNTSNVNFRRADTVANAAVVRADRSGEVCIYISAATHVLWDVHRASPGVDPASMFDRVGLRRVIDSRQGGGQPLKAGWRYTFGTSVTRPGAAVIGTLTIVDPAGDGYASITGCDGWPTTSNVNYQRGQTVAVTAVTATGNTGQICILTSAAAHVLWDQFAEAPGIAAVTPQRRHDTRLPR